MRVDTVKISVLMPVYNVANYVGEAIKSVLAQTYENFELIIVDDGSVDDTFSICLDHSRTDSRIHLLKNDFNIGIAETLNRAIAVARGDFFVRMDGDDISVANRFELLLNFLESNPDIVLVGSSTETIDEQDRSLGICLADKKYEVLSKIAKYSSPVLHIWMARRYVYEKIGPYRMPGVEDYDFLLRLMSENLKFSNVEDVLYKVRIRSGNTINSIGVVQRRLACYAYNLYLQRIKCGVDDFCQSDYLAARSPKNMEAKRYKKSAEFMLRAVAMKNKNLSLALFFVLCSCIISPYQLRYIYGKLYLSFLRKVN